MTPGRDCPLSYRYSPRSFARDPDIVAGTILVVGGLYGNVEALEAVLALAAKDDAAIVFNGDFHWFDTDPADYDRIGRSVLGHFAIRGNVETELADDDSGAGCGCGYPEEVDDGDVDRSNVIHAKLLETARRFPELRASQRALPMNLTARVGRASVGIVHGDASSLAGWNFAHDRLDDPKQRRWLEGAFAESGMDVFASSHTCLPACREFAFGATRGIVINNGAAGMPNFAGTRHGIVTRISTRPSPVPSLYGTECHGTFVDALALDFDAQAFERRFLASWPEGSPAHVSYYRRITRGPRFSLAQAAPLRTEISGVRLDLNKFWG
ncbi:hypothetical protein [Usitatibacter palustris]|uniref:Calcineurin-like phosphoesterase superfamily domain-containing protein n=1 Tax=Usitatibacter palustris TaxID=2732487 RepID=A0A6M4HC56_9PROT|nr:hypothetical protein [Usitatibacter palustris]QJR16645.1 hypothetical protein DSM104440_03480 [Usitatibacter palustris]